MILNKRILAICLALFIIVSAISSGSIGVEYLTHECSHDADCHVCTLYVFVSNFVNAITILLAISVFVVCLEKYSSKYRYKGFKLLPVELKVKMNN